MDSADLVGLKETMMASKCQDYRGHRGSVHCIGWSCTGQKLASGSSDHSIRIWAYPAGGKECIFEIKGHAGTVEQVAWSPVEPDVLASVSSDKTVRIWDAKSGLCLQKISTGRENLNLAWRPDGKVLATSSKDDAVSFWDVSQPASEAPRLHQHRFDTEVNEFGWDPEDPSRFLLTTGNGTLEAYALPSMERLTSCQGHTASVYCMDMAAGLLATGGADALVTLWDRVELAPVSVVGRLECPIRSVSLSNDGQLLASGSEDPFIDIASARTGELLHRLPTGLNGVNAIAWHPKMAGVLAFAGDESDPRSPNRSASSGFVRIFGPSASPSSSTTAGK